jgi:hypothetical protein
MVTTLQHENHPGRRDCNDTTVTVPMVTLVEIPYNDHEGVPIKTKHQR